MRANVPVDIDDVLVASKIADVRLTFRRRKLSFTSRAVVDGLGLANVSEMDMSLSGTAVIRVINFNNSLYTSRTLDLNIPAGSGTWTNRLIALKPGSRPGVHANVIWYQKTNGDICWRDFTLWVEHIVSSTFAWYTVGLAPVPTGVYLYALPDLRIVVNYDEPRAAFGTVAFLSSGGLTSSVWSGRSYGDLKSPRYIDAVTLGSTDYVYVMDRAAGRVVEITRTALGWSYSRYVVPIDAIDNITGVTLRYATVIKNQIFLVCRVVNSSDNNIPVMMDAVIYGPAIYDAAILDSRNQSNYSFSRWSYITTDNIGGKLFLPGDGNIYYLGSTDLLTSVATIQVGVDPVSLKWVTSDFFSMMMSEQENNGAQINLQVAHDINYVKALDEVTFEFGYNGAYVTMGVFDILNTEEAGAFGQLQFNLLGYTSSFADILMHTPHQSYYIASQDKINTNPATMMDVVVARGLFDKVTT